MFADSRHTHPEELRHSFLGTPKRFVLDDHLHFALFIGEAISQELYLFAHRMLHDYKLHKHLVQAGRLDLLQLLQTLGVEGDLAVEIGDVGGNFLLFFIRWNSKVHL